MSQSTGWKAIPASRQYRIWKFNICLACRILSLAWAGYESHAMPSTAESIASAAYSDSIAADSLAVAIHSTQFMCSFLNICKRKNPQAAIPTSGTSSSSSSNYESQISRPDVAFDTVIDSFPVAFDAASYYHTALAIWYCNWLFMIHLHNPFLLTASLLSNLLYRGGPLASIASNLSLVALAFKKNESWCRAFSTIK